MYSFEMTMFTAPISEVHYVPLRIQWILLPLNSTHEVPSEGLEIGHFEKNSRWKKLKTQEKNSITQAIN